MADSSAAVDRALLAFLNGICKRQFFGEEDVTDEFLRQDVLGGITEDGACIVSISRSASHHRSLVSRDLCFTHRVCSTIEAIFFNTEQFGLN